MVQRLVCLVLLPMLAFAAQAQETGKNVTLHKMTVLADTRTRLGYQLYVHPDCGSGGKATIRITREPKKGKSEVVAGMQFPNFPASDVRSKCNSQEVEATQVWYTPEAGFKGKDAFEYEMIGPTGQYRRTRVDVDVK